MNMFDIKAARAWVSGPEMGTHKACKYISAACDRIEELEARNAKLTHALQQIADSIDHPRGHARAALEGAKP